eukprot:TRINITY_DN4776_c0_g1_i4.p1 TRINITY_DN4776_c0_g1~~TRINITY_DN4776_c0_g1_i4.p1  ORF type:complete len:377 (+),score=127.52 TRINITY_DN4776_c0_g1_i4:459-1589(+)
MAARPIGDGEAAAVASNQLALADAPSLEAQTPPFAYCQIVLPEELQNQNNGLDIGWLWRGEGDECLKYLERKYPDVTINIESSPFWHATLKGHVFNSWQAATREMEELVQSICADAAKALVRNAGELQKAVDVLRYFESAGKKTPLNAEGICLEDKLSKIPSDAARMKFRVQVKKQIQELIDRGDNEFQVRKKIEAKISMLDSIGFLQLFKKDYYSIIAEMQRSKQRKADASNDGVREDAQAQDQAAQRAEEEKSVRILRDEQVEREEEDRLSRAANAQRLAQEAAAASQQPEDQEEAEDAAQAEHDRADREAAEAAIKAEQERIAERFQQTLRMAEKESNVTDAERARDDEERLAQEKARREEEERLAREEEESR